MDYSDYFNDRAQTFFDTTKRLPGPMKNEHNCYKTNIPNISCAKYLHLSGTSNQIEYGRQIRVENSTEFSRLAGIDFLEDYSKTDYSDSEFDVIHSIAGFHHYTPDKRCVIYNEMKRILKKDGVYVMADVRIGTEPAKFLNGFVDKYCPFGHKGIFLDDNDVQALKDTGFNVSTKMEHYTWNFTSWEECFEYTKSLFYLTKFTGSLDDFKRELQEYLKINENSDGSISWDWCLWYIITRRSSSISQQEH